MLIQKPEPLVIEATTEKEFPHQWIYNFSVHAPAINKGTAKFELLPYNSNTKEIGEGKFVETLTIDDLFKCVTEVPEAAQAYGAILNAIEPIREWVEARNAVDPETVEETETEEE